MSEKRLYHSDLVSCLRVLSDNGRRTEREVAQLVATPEAVNIDPRAPRVDAFLCRVLKEGETID